MWTTKENAKVETYIVSNSPREGDPWAEIEVNPNGERLFEVEVLREEYDQEIDPEHGVHYVNYPETLYDNREPITTAEGVKEAIGKYGIELPKDLEERLSTHERAFEIEKGKAQREYGSESERDAEHWEQTQREHALERREEDGIQQAETEIKREGQIGYTQEEYERRNDEVAIEREGELAKYGGYSKAEYERLEQEQIPGPALNDDDDGHPFGYSRGYSR